MNFRAGSRPWFGPESFAAAIVGLLCMSLPYTGFARDSAWLVVAPPVVGMVLLLIGATGVPFSHTLRRTGVGLVAAGTGFLMAILAFLGGIGLASVVV
jgi:hypothetical protein